MRYVYINDVGVVLEAEFLEQDGSVYPISNFSVMTMFIKKPDGTVLTKIPGYVTDGTDGLAQYTTAESDLDQPGTYRYQVYVEREGVEFHSDVFSFIALKNLGT